MTDTCNTTLLPCPFCGTAPVIMEYNFVPHAFCQPCGCTLEADKWNTRATQPTRDAEGAGELKSRLEYDGWKQASVVSGYWIKDKPDHEFVNVCNGDLRKLEEATHDLATPQPAPDAMREYAVRLKEIGDWLVAKENVHDASTLYSIARALSAPVPPHRGTARVATQAQHVSRPKGEPAKFVRNGKLEICQCLDCRALLTSASGASEPVAWQKRPTFGDVPIWTLVEHSPHTHDFWREQEYELRPLYATPPVRGDREEIADDIRPREPTPAMRIVGGVAWIDAMKSAETYVDCADACWKAMWDKASI